MFGYIKRNTPEEKLYKKVRDRRWKINWLEHVPGASSVGKTSWLAYKLDINATGVVSKIYLMLRGTPVRAVYRVRQAVPCFCQDNVVHASVEATYDHIEPAFLEPLAALVPHKASVNFHFNFQQCLCPSQCFDLHSLETIEQPTPEQKDPRKKGSGQETLHQKDPVEEDNGREIVLLPQTGIEELSKLFGADAITDFANFMNKMMPTGRGGGGN